MRNLGRKVIFILFIGMLLLNPYRTYAAPTNDLQRASLDYISSLVSLATYNDRAGSIARAELMKRHWLIKSYSERFNEVDAKFLVVENVVDSKEIYILAVAGTENVHDIKTDLNFSKVFFGGNTPEEFVEAAKKKNITSKEPMVHSGFDKYTNIAFFMKKDIDGKTYGEYWASFLKANPNRKLFLVGHSLGGAIVTVSAARLISLGVDPKQIEVITFGAPAVGNSAFANQYGSKIPLRRIVFGNDPVKSVLQSISGGYAQFGDAIVWDAHPKLYKREHAIGVYVDEAMRNYYNAKLAVSKDRVVEREGKDKCYVAPLDITVVDDYKPDLVYFRESMYDTFVDTMGGFFFDLGEKEPLERLLTKAKSKGCKWLILTDLNVTKVQKKKFGHYVSYEELIYDVGTGYLKGSLIYTNGTGDFTAMQSMIHNLSEAQVERERIFRQN